MSRWNHEDEITRTCYRLQALCLGLIPVFIAAWTVAAIVKGN